MRVYYAHCVALYNTKQEERDIATLEKLFPQHEIFNPNCEACSEGYAQKGMKFFRRTVNDSDILAFRALPEGLIPAGVYTEIQWAIEDGKTIIELPKLYGREMSIDDTRQYIREVGAK
jgi:hypothetical protein